MRGTVTLAAALALPTGGDGGAPFPYRDLILVTAFGVVLGTLVLQGLTLRPLLLRLRLEDDGTVEREVRLARVETLRAAVAAAAACPGAETAELVRHRYELQLRRAEEELARDGADGTAPRTASSPAAAQTRRPGRRRGGGARRDRGPAAAPRGAPGRRHDRRRRVPARGGGARLGGARLGAARPGATGRHVRGSSANSRIPPPSGAVAVRQVRVVAGQRGPGPRRPARADPARQLCRGGLSFPRSVPEPLRERRKRPTAPQLRRRTDEALPRDRAGLGRAGFVAVRFHARGAYLFFHRPLREVAAGVVALEDLWRDRAREWTERIALAKDMATRVRFIEHALLALLAENGRTEPAVDRALHLIEASQGQVRVNQLAAEIGVSSRHLRRHFERAVGASPKEFARIRRFVHALRVLTAGHHRSLADVALDAASSTRRTSTTSSASWPA